MRKTTKSPGKKIVKDIKRATRKHYSSEEKIMDERYGAAHDYTRKTGVAASFILAPENAPDWMSNRAELWNAVEAVERRKDAQLCREVLLSLPHELTDDQREALVRQFVRDQFVSKGMIADVNIHSHSPSGDERNDHAHILLTTRTLTASSFGPKERSWNSAGGGVRPGDKRREDGEQKPPAPPEQPENARRRPESEIDPEDVLASSSPGRQADNARARIEPEGEQPREKTGLFEKRDKRESDGAARADEVLTPKSRERTGKDNVRGRIEEPEKKPHFLDPDYKGPSKEELNRARDLEKAIRVHKAREARKRAAERRRLERDKDQDGPER